MSIFAGIYSRRPELAIPANVISELSSAVSRYPGDVANRTEFSYHRMFIVKVDLGALGTPGESFSPGLSGFVAGDPLLQYEDGAMPISRDASLTVMMHDLVNGGHNALRACRGTYCAVVYDQSANRLHLITDKLGVRPLYCWIMPDFIVFATALRVLEALTSFKRSLNLQGVAEVASFGFPLADHTPYDDIIALHAGEVVSIDADSLTRHRYWRWDELPPEQAPGNDTSPPERLFKLFLDAVSMRLRGQKVVASFLSGGLDSRAIVAALKGFGTEVFTANFAWPGSQDQVFGQLAADRLGAHYAPLQMNRLVDGDPYSVVSVQDWLSSEKFLAHSPERPRVIWSGDGGSVGLGHVYLNEDIVAATRAGDLQGAMKKFCAYNNSGFNGKLLKREVDTLAHGMVNDAFKAELELVHPSDPGRIFFLFLMHNDQRRHLSVHFENIDLSRIEIELPFFDADFIAGIMREPIDCFLRHVFYMEWLKCFPLGVLEIPWQSYPNHIPCTLPSPVGLAYQWDRTMSAEDIKKSSRAALGAAWNLLLEKEFSREFLSSGYMWLFILLSMWGKVDRSYLLKAPLKLYRYWSKTKVSSNDA